MSELHVPTVSERASTFAALLRHFRDRAELTQEALAEHAGLSPDAIGLLERGERRRPRADTVVRLAKVLVLSSTEQAQFEATARRAAPLSIPGQPHLPSLLTPLVGRAAILKQIVAIVEPVSARLITLTGPGGVGKTRLALAVAERMADAFADGVVFVPLAAVLDPDLVPTAWAAGQRISIDAATSEAKTAIGR